MKLMMTELKDGIFQENDLRSEKERIDHLISLREPARDLWNAYRTVPCTAATMLYPSKPHQEAYMLRYMPFYSLALEAWLRHIDANLQTMQIVNTNAHILGGGPGTEILGICQYLASKGVKSSNIIFNILDKHAKSWGYAREIVRNYAIKKLDINNIEINVMDFDFVSDDFKVAKQTSNPNLFIAMNMFNEISEGVDTHSAISKITKLIEQSNRGSVIIFIDRNYDVVDIALDQIKNSSKQYGYIDVIYDNVFEDPWQCDLRNFAMHVDHEIATYLFKAAKSNAAYMNSDPNGLWLSMNFDFKVLIMKRN